MQCEFCGTESRCIDDEIWICPCCGKYRINIDFLSDIMDDSLFQKNKHLLSGYIRELNEYNEKPELTIDNYKSIFSHSLIPKTPLQKVDKLISYMYRHTKMLYECVTVPLNPAIAYCLNNEELSSVIRCAKDMGYLSTVPDVMNVGTPIHAFLTVKGLEKAEQIKKEDPFSQQGFVAMWFDKEMMNIFENHIAPAIKEAGFDPFIIPMKDHNDDITDHIIAEIRRSRFVVADFTGQRGGVYFEAGFAYGLGLPVIWTCREDWFNPPGEVARKVHFDVDHYNFIVWKEGADLQKRLLNRIRATVI